MDAHDQETQQQESRKKADRWGNNHCVSFSIQLCTFVLILTDFQEAHVWGSKMKENLTLVRLQLKLFFQLVQPQGGREGRGYSQKTWAGVCGPQLKPHTLFMTKICDIPYPIYDLTKNSKPYL